MEKKLPYGLGVELTQLADFLRDKGWMLGTAESCTGGMIASLCTSVEGSSQWFMGGVVSYANALKTSLLGVDAGLIAEHGAVSQPVAEAMALGALTALNVDIGVGITGIAGPAGGVPGKPVGTVWIAVSMRHGETSVTSRCFCFRGDREQIRLGATQTAIYNVLDRLGALG